MIVKRAFLVLTLKQTYKGIYIYIILYYQLNAYSLQNCPDVQACSKYTWRKWRVERLVEAFQSLTSSPVYQGKLVIKIKKMDVLLRYTTIYNFLDEQETTLYRKLHEIEELKKLSIP